MLSVDNPSDWHLLHMLQDYIAKNNCKKIPQLHGLQKCTRSVINISSRKEQGVYVFSNGEHTKAIGARYCKAAWGCPVCEPYKMSQKAAIIACGIEALKKQGLVPIHITFTVSHHTESYSCCQVSEILKLAWLKFTSVGTKLQQGYKKKTKSGKVNHHIMNRNDPLGLFRNELNSKFYVRAYEYTWGSYGWHPHIHALFWVNKRKLNQVLKYEKLFLDYWRKLIYNATIKVFQRDIKDPAKFESFKANLDARFESCDFSRVHERNLGVYIAQRDGMPIVQEASHYICGWGADKEITGNFERKASNDGHYSPYQMLLEAAKLDRNSDEFKTWMNRYLEYTIAAKAILTARVMFGFKKEFLEIVRNWKLTNDYIEVFKKKVSNAMATKAKWYVVYWFSEKQWSMLSTKKLLPYIMAISILPNAKEVIDRTLELYDIKPTETIPKNKYSSDILAKLNQFIDIETDCDVYIEDDDELTA